MISLYKELLVLCEKEHVALENGDIDTLEECNRLKDEVVQRIERLDKTEANMLSPEQGNEVEAIIRKILAANEKSVSSIRVMREKTVAELSSLGVGKKAHKAYASGTAGSSQK